MYTSEQLITCTIGAKLRTIVNALALTILLVDWGDPTHPLTNLTFALWSATASSIFVMKVEQRNRARRLKTDTRSNHRGWPAFPYVLMLAFFTLGWFGEINVHHHTRLPSYWLGLGVIALGYLAREGGLLDPDRNQAELRSPDAAPLG